MNDQIIFICGHRKSGTTLLLNLLDGHPELAVFPTDLNYLYAYFPTFVGSEYSNEQRRERLERVLFAELESFIRSAGLPLDVRDLRQRFYSHLGERLNDIGAITSALAAAYREISGAKERPFVGKETSIEIYASELLKKLPGAKFVHLVRDPRDNFAALKAGVASYYSKLGEDENVTLASLLHRGRLGLEYAVANKTLYPSNVLVVRFEDLVSGPDSTLSEITNFLGVSDWPGLRTPTEMGKPTRGNNFDGFDLYALSRRNVSRWRERITDTEAQVIEFHCRSVMDKFGYQPAFGLEDQAAGAAEFYKWQNYKYFFADRFKTPLAP
jgi:hypothetical protein